jgi:hypothetical protein
MDDKNQEQENKYKVPSVIRQIGKHEAEIEGIMREIRNLREDLFKNDEKHIAICKDLRESGEGNKINIEGISQAIEKNGKISLSNNGTLTTISQDMKGEKGGIDRWFKILIGTNVLTFFLTVIVVYYIMSSF